MPPTRACDACKLRKVKCDMSSPCANCRISQLDCAHTIIPRKRGRKPGRQLQATQSPNTPPEGNAERHWNSPSTSSQCLQSVVSPTSLLVLEEPIVETYAAARRIHTGLSSAFASAFPSESLLDVIHRCIDLFAQYMFPLTPVFHEPSLRSSVALFRLDDCPISWASPETLKTFTLITALCACVTSALPDCFPAQRHSLSTLFLKSSRAMHYLYVDEDLASPDSSSLSIRMWHSRALQSITGSKTGSLHCALDAAIIAQRLQLYDENSISKNPEPESQLLRACFWGLFSADKAACAFGDRPYLLNEMLFAGRLTLLERGEHDGPLLDSSRSCNQEPLESRLLVGFHLKRRVWSMAGDLIRDMRLYARSNNAMHSNAHDRDARFAHLTDKYLMFMGLMDDLPSWLQTIDSDRDRCTVDPDVASYQAMCFKVQRSNLMIAFHCLRLTILKNCIENNTLAIVGLEGQDLALSIKTVDIAHDFLRELQIAPFMCLKILGEAGVEQIRLVGVVLLELIETVRNDTLKQRAASLFQRLLDVLAKLDSKASDQLREG